MVKGHWNISTITQQYLQSSDWLILCSWSPDLPDKTTQYIVKNKKYKNSITQTFFSDVYSYYERWQINLTKEVPNIAWQIAVDENMKALYYHWKREGTISLFNINYCKAKRGKICCGREYKRKENCKLLNRQTNLHWCTHSNDTCSWQRHPAVLATLIFSW